MEKKSRLKAYKEHWPLYLMLLPGLVYLLINNYIPMAGIVIAFKKLNFAEGIFASPWAGFENFKFLFATKDAWIITRNTLLYNVAFILVNMVVGIAIAILLLRYPDSFEGYVEVHEEVRDAEIFPFLIQVFVENAAKHALTLEEKILISVTVYPEDREEGTYVNIYISDTGDGFAPDVLERLQRGEGLSSGGHHVGIDNCLKRFHLYYNGLGEMNFSNSPLGGAIVDIHIPYRRYTDTEDAGRAEHETVNGG